MNAQRTGGMTTMGILNIVFGSLGCIGGLVMVLAGGAIAAVGAGAESEAAGAAAMGGAIGAIAGVIGLVFLALWATVIVAGIGVLKMRSWGRMLSMVCGVIIVLLAIAGVATGSFSLGTIFMIAYGGALFGLMMKPDWKAAFSGQTSTDATFSDTAAPIGMPGVPQTDVADEETRTAA